MPSDNPWPYLARRLMEVRFEIAAGPDLVAPPAGCGFQAKGVWREIVDAERASAAKERERDEKERWRDRPLKPLQPPLMWGNDAR